MSLDIYLSKKTFIGAMTKSSKVGGSISFSKKGKPRSTFFFDFF